MKRTTPGRSAATKKFDTAAESAVCSEEMGCGQDTGCGEENGTPVAMSLCDDAIRDLAYQKWMIAGCPEGESMHFWLEAESELVLSAVRKIPR